MSFYACIVAYYCTVVVEMFIESSSKSYEKNNIFLSLKTRLLCSIWLQLESEFTNEDASLSAKLQLYAEAKKKIQGLNNFMKQFR